jgi:hypothetical protein
VSGGRLGDIDRRDSFGHRLPMPQVRMVTEKTRDEYETYEALGLTFNSQLGSKSLEYGKVALSNDNCSFIHLRPIMSKSTWKSP